jgi:hypothetical protein
MGCLVDVSQPPLTPTVHPATKPAALFANNVLPIYAALPNPPPPPSDQQWVRELIGSIGDISGIESMETANTSMHLGAGYHQCKVARRGKVSNSHFDVSVERGGGEDNHCTLPSEQLRHTAREWVQFLFYWHTEHGHMQTEHHKHFRPALSNLPHMQP